MWLIEYYPYIIKMIINFQKIHLFKYSLNKEIRIIKVKNF